MINLHNHFFLGLVNSWKNCFKNLRGFVVYLDELVPSRGNNNGILGKGRESDAWDPFGVSLFLDGVFANSQSVPQFDGSVAGGGNDLTVVSRESDGKDILGVSNKSPGLLNRRCNNIFLFYIYWDFAPFSAHFKKLYFTTRITFNLTVSSEISYPRYGRYRYQIFRLKKSKSRWSKSNLLKYANNYWILCPSGDF